MKYFILLFHLIFIGCINHDPDSGEAIGIIIEMSTDFKNHTNIQIYSRKIGYIRIFDSPYFNKLETGDRIVVEFDDMKSVHSGKPFICHILGKITDGNREIE